MRWIKVVIERDKIEFTPLRAAIVTAALILAILAFISLCPVLHAQTVKENTVRLSDVDRRLTNLESLPVKVAVMESNFNELVNWARLIGAAVVGAIGERFVKGLGGMIKKRG